MCGIAGAFHLDVPEPEIPSLLGRMNQALVHRGPDDEGRWTAPELGAGLAVRRLSIIDLITGSQPLLNEDGSVGLAANGEIYNHPQLRAELETRGHRFRSRSDCEVILHLYEEYGVECLRRLNGMFALAILDRRNQRLLLARDPAGMKPLYYTRTPKGFLFASEAKALFASGLVSAEPDWGGLSLYLTHSFCPAPKTCFRGVERLPAGTFLLMDREHEHQGRFWTMRFDGARSPRSEEDWAADLEHKLRAAVASHLAADVPVGAFLSGGWDSSLITVFAAEASARRLKTFSLAFPEAPHENEARYSRLVAERAGSEHHEVEFRTTQAPALLAKAVEALEEPCATAPAILFFHLSAAASREVKTVIGGEGSDELFAGYRWLLSNWPYALRRVTPRAALSPLAGLVRDGRWGRLLRLATADSELQAHLEWHHRFAGETPSELLHPDLPIQPNPDTCLFSPPAETWESCRDRLEQRLSLEFTGRLADGILLVDDKASMAHSLEVRLPFLDRAVVDFALSLPSGLKVKDGREKHILSHLARRHLPPEVARRRKYGLHFPMKGKPNAAFAAFLRETLLSARNPEIFQRTPLERWLGEALAGRLGGQSRAWGLAVFASWWDRFVG